jgi:hypothetical protein
MSNSEMIVERVLGHRLTEAANDARTYMTKAEREFRELRFTLTKIHLLTGQVHGTGPGEHSFSDMSITDYAGIVWKDVAELRQAYDELTIERDVLAGE